MKRKFHLSAYILNGRWFYVCPVCGNKDPKYFGVLNGKKYCRKCISFQRGKKTDLKVFHPQELIHADLTYGLTKTQSKASEEILSFVKNKKSCIVNAVCGSGKTELVYASIEYFLNKGQRVAFAIPRKDVVIEIYDRLKNDYPKVAISCVYGGHTDSCDGQLVCLTTHQLYRYSHYFDLLILDEADAFPYYQNDLLETFLNKSCNAVIIYLSATMKDDYLKICKNVVYVNRRFHNYDLPVPEIKRYLPINKYDVLKKTVSLIDKKPILIFVPTIDIGNKLSLITKYPFVYSYFKEKQQYIDDFKNGKIRILITSSILERGITIKGCQVIVFEADHLLFDDSSLIQISGRVGRKLSDPTGKVYFLAATISKSMKKCIAEIKKKNESR